MSALVRHTEDKTATIAASGTTSDAFFVGDHAWGSFQLPTMTGTGITFLVSNDGNNYVALRDNTGTAIASITTASGRAMPFPDELFYHKFAKIVSGSAEDAERLINVFLKG